MLAADLRPLKDHFEDHVYVHRGYTEPQYPFLPALGAQPQQRHAKRCFSHGLPYQRAAGRDVDEYVHAVVPFFRRISKDITGRILVDDYTVCGQ